EESPEDGYDLQQFMIPENCQLVNNTVSQINAKLKQINGPLLVGIAKHTGGGQFQLFPNPADQMMLFPYDCLIVLGNQIENGVVAEYLGVVQGR
ncbi:MAG: hypothetical protein KC561_10580, partial [Myxococcales bacterium]|nr:hypothetical protein [Myxococcales bacterium]